jgi:hypothetical protein
MRILLSITFAWLLLQSTGQLPAVGQAVAAVRAFGAH